jgi:hypothetical protein
MELTDFSFLIENPNEDSKCCKRIMAIWDAIENYRPVSIRYIVSKMIDMINSGNIDHEQYREKSEDVRKFCDFALSVALNYEAQGFVK